MSATLSTINRRAVSKTAIAFSRLFSACMDGIARYFARRAAIACLSELDDRALRDIGLVRCQIEAAVHGFMSAPDRGAAVIRASSSAPCAATREAGAWS